MGTLTAKEAKKANHKTNCLDSLNSNWLSNWISVVPLWKYITITPNNINIDPNKV
jgi:hypothetical protein|tara:strand:- start:423 stop:587 length:165 start_codon:yes stop_codon:yes gene_type:complete